VQSGLLRQVFGLTLQLSVSQGFSNEDGLLCFCRGTSQVGAYLLEGGVNQLVALEERMHQGPKTKNGASVLRTSMIASFMRD